MTRTLHGFSSWIDFLKATASLGGMLTLGLWGILTYALDGRYAPAALAATVAGNVSYARKISDKVEDVEGTVTAVQAVIWEDKIFEIKLKICGDLSPEGREFLVRRLGELIQEYADITDENAFVPSCEDVQ